MIPIAAPWLAKPEKTVYSPPPFGFPESRIACPLALVVGSHLIAQEIAQVEVLDFWVGAGEFGFA